MTMTHSSNAETDNFDHDEIFNVKNCHGKAMFAIRYSMHGRWWWPAVAKNVLGQIGYFTPNRTGSPSYSALVLSQLDSFSGMSLAFFSSQCVCVRRRAQRETETETETDRVSMNRKPTDGFRFSRFWSVLASNPDFLHFYFLIIF
jgi:hypothetical protein